MARVKVSKRRRLHIQQKEKQKNDNTQKLFLILLPVSVLMLVFFVGTAKATSESFVIGPKQQAVEYIDLSVSDQANGSMWSALAKSTFS